MTYKTIKEFGKGTFGVVELVTDANGQRWARKTFVPPNLSGVSNDDMRARFTSVSSCPPLRNWIQKRRQRMAKEPKKLDELFHDTLKDIYFAEKKILSTLPKMAKAAQNEELKAAFEKHRGETEGQVERLEQVFAMIQKKPQGKTCAAIVGITDEGAEIMKEYKGSPALDAGLLGAAQAVEHYEISRYGTLKAWAEELGLNDAAELLQETLEEEEATDEALTEIAKSAINQQAEAA
jgi:ferritin-like metal-binding protein YciE